MFELFIFLCFFRSLYKKSLKFSFNSLISELFSFLRSDFSLRSYVLHVYARNIEVEGFFWLEFEKCPVKRHAQMKMGNQNIV